MIHEAPIMEPVFVFARTVLVFTTLANNYVPIIILMNLCTRVFITEVLRWNLAVDILIVRKANIVGPLCIWKCCKVIIAISWLSKVDHLDIWVVVSHEHMASEHSNRSAKTVPRKLDVLPVRVCSDQRVNCGLDIGVDSLRCLWILVVDFAIALRPCIPWCQVLSVTFRCSRLIIRNFSLRHECNPNSFISSHIPDHPLSPMFSFLNHWMKHKARNQRIRAKCVCCWVTRSDDPRVF